MTNPFAPAKRRGDWGEEQVGRAFAEHYAVTHASLREDRSGIDFWFAHGGLRIAVQVKTDDEAAKTGNAFVETASVCRCDDGDAQGATPGWALTARADVLLYYIPPWRETLIIPMRYVREHLAVWREKYPERQTRDELNDGYHTHGVCVALTEFRHCPRREMPVA